MNKKGAEMWQLVLILLAIIALLVFVGFIFILKGNADSLLTNVGGLF